MYLIERTHLPTGIVDHFGPFPSIDRAEIYCKSFDLKECSYEIWALIVPNCVTVKVRACTRALREAGYGN